MTMDAMECMLGRQSTPAALLAEPAPNDDEILTLLETAMRAPDHGALQPWRFLIIRDGRRHDLGEIFAAALARREPDSGPDEIEKARGKATRAPLVLAVWAEIVENHPKVPAIEQVVATAAALQNLLNALHARGYNAILVTGAPCYDENVKAPLGLAPKDVLVGFIHIGTARDGAAPKKRPNPAEFLQIW
ncbi:MAG: nitroreductase [Alphaproteobacteria bacterium]|jgi:nitroreductase|nr:nitroreductase [Alphaproteobacteria bacterium]MDP6874824.1 nitroreductase [Alphaproteobacteria bacterium]